MIKGINQDNQNSAGEVNTSVLIKVPPSLQLNLKIIKNRENGQDENVLKYFYIHRLHYHNIDELNNNYYNVVQVQ